VTEEVKELADQAQVDVGYDYIWLDDVTYLDWQRYHALLDSELLRLLMHTCCSLVYLILASKNFTELAMSIQNGSHPSPPIDPIPTAMHELQLELQDVIAGFETRLRRIKRNGFKAFDSLHRDTMDGEDADHDVEMPPLSPEVSILSIPGDEPNPAAPVLGSEFAVVGRGKAEVEEAFARADAVSDQEHSQVLGHTSADGTNKAESSQISPTVVPPSMSSLRDEL
jgi:hypothetical protein